MTEAKSYQAKKEIGDIGDIQSKITANALFNFMPEYSFFGESNFKYVNITKILS